MRLVSTYFLHSSGLCGRVYTHTGRRHNCRHSGIEGCSGTRLSPPHSAHLQGHIPVRGQGGKVDGQVHTKGRAGSWGLKILPILTEKYPDICEGADLFKYIFNQILCPNATTS